AYCALLSYIDAASCNLTSDDGVFFTGANASTGIYTLSLHDALPISAKCSAATASLPALYASTPASKSICPGRRTFEANRKRTRRDRKSTRLNSSHEWISYAVFCLKKKNGTN